MGNSCSHIKTTLSDNELPTYNEELPLYPIRLLDYDILKTMDSFPRCPENKDLLVTYDEIDKENSLVIFLSHCWLRGYRGAPGYNIRPHPDSVGNDKFKLTMEAVEKTMKHLSPEMTKCYLWIDFSCIDQNASACLELKMLDKIIGASDLILTPIYDPDPSWELPRSYNNIFNQYLSPGWNGGDHSYLNRGWTRVEMLYAANIPLAISSPTRVLKFKSGLHIAAVGGFRPHLLYGSYEQRKLRNPRQLPPLQNSWFDEFHPKKGKLSKETDRIHIRRLVDKITPLMKRVMVCYEGAYKDKKKHGKGLLRYETGDVYEGDWEYDRRHGKGLLRRATGDVYEGDWEYDKMHGKGMHQYATGTVYEGDLKHDSRHGKGVLLNVNGDVYDGDWENDKKHGKGVCRYANGDVYDGDWENDKRHGKGVRRYANGNVYEGDWNDDNRNGKGEYRFASGDVYYGESKDNRRHGKGEYRFATGAVYEGDWADNKRHGKGVFRFEEDDVYEGDWENDVRHGKGLIRYVTGDVYDGDWENDKKHGKGVCRYANGDVYEGDYKVGKRHGKGVLLNVNGDVYEGDWENGEWHGKGVLRYATGDVYEGYWLVVV